MRGVARSFWTLVAIVAVVEGVLVFLALRSLDRVLPCWWSVPIAPNPSTTSCGESVAIFGHNTWIPGVGILGFVCVTLLAGAVTLLSQVARTRRAVRVLGPAVPVPDRLAHSASSLKTEIALIDDPRCFCACTGFVTPRIMISTEMLGRLDDEQLTAVLAHEKEHVRRRDPVRAAAVRAASNALFYLPLARHLAQKSLVASELRADATATSATSQRALIGALIQVLGEARPALGSATELVSLDALDTRIEVLRTRKLPRFRPAVWVSFVTVLGVAAVLGLILLLPPSATGVVHQHILHIAPGYVPGRPG
jgi:beta-lactamase regulating signal transducer with metallopeptidase domain